MEYVEYLKMVKEKMVNAIGSQLSAGVSEVVLGGNNRGLYSNTSFTIVGFKVSDGVPYALGVRYEGEAASEYRIADLNIETVAKIHDAVRRSIGKASKNTSEDRGKRVTVLESCPDCFDLGAYEDALSSLIGVIDKYAPSEIEALFGEIEGNGWSYDDSFGEGAFDFSCEIELDRSNMETSADYVSADFAVCWDSETGAWRIWRASLYVADSNDGNVSAVFDPHTLELQP